MHTYIHTYINTYIHTFIHILVLNIYLFIAGGGGCDASACFDGRRGGRRSPLPHTGSLKLLAV
jgi:hypothetical protein